MKRIKGGFFLKYKKNIDGFLVILMFLSAILSVTLIFIRIQVASKNQELPNYRILDDTVAVYEEPSFYTDELFYYNFIPKERFFPSFFEMIFSVQSLETIRNTNFYGYYIYYVKKLFVWNDNMWYLVIFFSGFPAYLVFVLLTYYIFKNILKFPSKKAFVLTLMLIFSPVLLIHSASWLRDVIIYDLMLVAIISSFKKNLTIFLLATSLQVIIRGYMIFPHILIFLNFWPRTFSKRNVIMTNIVGILITYLLLQMIVIKNGLNNLINRFIPKIIESLFGLNKSLFLGLIVPRGSIYSILYDFGATFPYYYSLSIYFLIYIGVLLEKIYSIQFSDLEKRFWYVFLWTAIILSILHSGFLGYFVPRIVFIFEILAWLAFGASKSPLTKSCKMSVKQNNSEKFYSFQKRTIS